MSLDAKLLCVANVAYEITSPGQLYSTSDWYAKAGFLAPPVAIVGGPDGINAAIVGKIAEGTVVSFRGTLSADDETKPFADRLLDWTQDFEAELVTYRGIPGTVHGGFAAAFESLFLDLEEIICDDTKVIYCGHSKGGAIANIAAYYDAVSFDATPTVVTFGAPRCGDVAFADAFARLPIKATRYENAGDIVPHVPFTLEIADIVAKHTMASTFRLDYQSVGVLQYINRPGVLFGKSFLQAADSKLALGELIAKGDFAGIRNAHSIHNVGHGYASIV